MQKIYENWSKIKWQNLLTIPILKRKRKTWMWNRTIFFFLRHKKCSRQYHTPGIESTCGCIVDFQMTLFKFALHHLFLQIVNKLNQYIVGQEHAKKVLAVAVYNHYKRITQHKAKLQKQKWAEEKERQGMWTCVKQSWPRHHPFSSSQTSPSSLSKDLKSTTSSSS